MTAATTFAARTVLVADDTAFVRDRFRSALERAGHTAVTAQNGHQLLALLHARAGAVDLVVLDLRLPQGNGVALLHAIRKAAGAPAVVIFSGTIASASEVRELEALGVVGYVNEYAATQHIAPSLAPHLCPERVNRRASPRVHLGIPVSYRVTSMIAVALSLNIGHGGLAVRTTSPVAVDTPLRLRFRLPGAAHEIEAEARVAWTDRRLGMGVQFTRVSRDDEARIDEYVRAHFFSNRKA